MLIQFNLIGDMFSDENILEATFLNGKPERVGNVNPINIDGRKSDFTRFKIKGLIHDLINQRRNAFRFGTPSNLKSYALDKTIDGANQLAIFETDQPFYTWLKNALLPQLKTMMPNPTSPYRVKYEATIIELENFTNQKLNA